MYKRLNIKIFGQVQGVFFRQQAKKLAEKLGIFGFIRNEPDGSVYIEAEGNQKSLKDFLAWCRKGSSLAKVDKLDVVQCKNLKNFNTFSIKHEL